MRKSNPDAPAVNDSFAPTTFSGLPEEVVYKNPA
jgi:hypothetical protein